MISARYGVRAVRHSPGSALLTGDRYRCRSAHWLTESLGSGFMPARNPATSLKSTFDIYPTV